jgi:acyl carrier protein
MSEQIRTRVCTIIQNEFGFNPAETWRENQLDGCDKLDLALILEEEYGISLDDEIVDKFTSLDAIVSIVEARLQDKIP